MTLFATYIVVVFSLNFLFYVVLNPIFNFNPTYQFYSSSFIAIVFHGLIIGLQNRLYEEWRESALLRNIIILLFCGGLVGYITNAYLYEVKEIGHIIGVSTMAAIFFTGLFNFAVYHALREKSLTLSIMLSAVVSACIDPAIFYISALSFGKDWTAALQTIPAVAVGAMFWSYIFINNSSLVTEHREIRLGDIK